MRKLRCKPLIMITLFLSLLAAPAMKVKAAECAEETIAAAAAAAELVACDSGPSTRCTSARRDYYAALFALYACRAAMLATTPQE